MTRGGGTSGRAGRPRRPSPRRAPGASQAAPWLVVGVLLSACAAEPDEPSEHHGTADPDGEEPSGEDGDAGTDGDAATDGDDGSFTIISSGDVLPHDNVLESAATEDGYDFSPLMVGVEDWISGADLALCSLEVPLSPEGVDPRGYPVFGAPPELVPDLQDLGFHGCSTANNHAMDSGLEGLVRTLDVFDEHGMGHVGTARDEAEGARSQLYSLERGGEEIVVAHLATTRLHNEVHPVPQDQPWTVSDVSAEELTAQADEAREEGADVVVASVHWGDEYVHEPTPDQIDYADRLADGGSVDVVFGGHSHTPQPLEELDGGPGGEGMWVAWSMGNFLSNQDEACCVMETATGTMVVADVDVTGEDPRVTGLEWAPVTVDRGPTDADGHRGIWPLDELLDEGIPEELDLDVETARERQERVLEVMGEETRRSEPPVPTGEGPEVAPRGP